MIMTSPHTDNNKKDNDNLLLSPSTFSPVPKHRHNRNNNNFAMLTTVLVTAMTCWKLSAMVNNHSRIVEAQQQDAYNHANAIGLAGWKTAASQSSSSRCNCNSSTNKKTLGPRDKTLRLKNRPDAHNSNSASSSSSLPLYHGPSRVWNVRKQGFPCFPGSEPLMVTSPAHRGFLFHRPTKVGSTTMVSIVLRLAHNRLPLLSEKKSGSLTCQHRSMHGTGLSLEYDQRERSNSFLFSLIRDPTKRAISDFFHFGVAVSRIEPTDKAFRYYLHTHPNFQHFYLADLGVRNYTKNTSQTEMLQTLARKYNKTTTQQYTEFVGSAKPPSLRFQLMAEQQEYMRFGFRPNWTMIVEHVLEDYDFVAVTERMDESLVVMQLLLNLTTKDILYTRARSSGGWSNGHPDRPCILIPPSYISPNMKEYFQSSKEWHDIVRGDLLLYQAVNASLDRTIEALGRERFQRHLEAFHAGLKLAEQNCKGRVRTLCSEGGEPINETTCYIWGEACDHECINELEL